MESQTYYHLCQIPLAPGSQILPGNWGRVERMQSRPSVVLYREYVLESMRAREFPDKPSRLNCVFAFPSIDHAATFVSLNPDFGSHRLYEVTTEALNSSLHYADHYFPPEYPGFLDHIEEMVRKYWTEQPLDRVEILIPAAVTVNRMIA